MSHPICPINNAGIRYPIMCSDGYMYEERCIEQIIELGILTSPVSRDIIMWAEKCDIGDKCFNNFGDDKIEDEYDYSNFSYKLDLDRFDFKAFCDESLENGFNGFISDKGFLSKLIEHTNCGCVLNCASPSLINDEDIYKKTFRMDIDTYPFFKKDNKLFFLNSEILNYLFI